jgi:membrane fusion protein, multidrug efflux system
VTEGGDRLRDGAPIQLPGAEAPARTAGGPGTPQTPAIATGPRPQGGMRRNHPHAGGQPQRQPQAPPQ